MILLLIVSTLFLMLMPEYAHAEGGVKATLTTIFKNGEEAWVSITIFLGAVMFVTGIGLGVLSIMKFKAMADGKATIVQPIVLLVISAALIASPSFIMTIANTYYESAQWSPVSLLSSIPQGDMLPGTAEALSSVLIFVQMLGFIAFFRGMLMFKALAEGKQGMFGKAATHVLGGVLAINIQMTVGMLARTFFQGSDLPIGMENW